MSFQRCESCRYWKPIKADLGLCRLGPPVIADGGSMWPTTEPSDWCGEYASAVVPIPKIAKAKP